MRNYLFQNLIACSIIIDARHIRYHNNPLFYACLGTVPAKREIIRFATLMRLQIVDEAFLVCLFSNVEPSYFASELICSHGK